MSGGKVQDMLAEWRSITTAATPLSTTMFCPRCQHENLPQSKFCLGCGARFGLRCPICGVVLTEDAKFCNQCGCPLAGGPSPAHARYGTPGSYTPKHLAERILTSRSALEGEYKQVSVLFCDIANSTALAARVGAEGMHQLLNAFFDLALVEVHRYEGTINQFLGDGFMALFGAPIAHEDHARRAALAATGVQQRLRSVSEKDPAGLGQISIRMGMNTGPVVVGKIGDNLRMDYTAIGDTTNLAARLQQLAKAGLTYVSESTYMAARSYFDAKPLGKHILKGIADPVVVYALGKARADAEEGSRAQSIGIGSVLIGRDSELAALNNKVQALVRGEGGIVALTGEPGLGKSRLVAEAKRHAADNRLLWLEGRALSFGHNLSYWPFIEILKRSFAIDENDTEEQSWSKLEHGVRALFADGTPGILPYVATVLALRVPARYEDRIKFLDSQALGRQVFLSMRQLFERMARRQPIVLLFEDWHWADRSSVGLVEHLLPLIAGSQLLIWCVTRPDPGGPITRIRRAAIENPEYRFQEVVLSPLSEGDSATLVGKLVGMLELPGALREQILRKTEGNPFFIEEVIRSLVSEGVLTRGPRDLSWHLAKAVDHLNLPDTIQGLILARIDRLDEEVKQVLKLASVIGRSFFYRVLVAITEAERELDSSLSQLEHAELIRLRQRVPEVEYIFKHALVQETSYGSILAERRRGIHRRVADAIERLFGERTEEFASLLAYHYTRAEDWQKAQEYLFKAGDQAGRVAADAEALEHFRQAEAAYLRAFGDKISPLQGASLDRKMGTALFGLGQYEQARGHFRRALAQLGIAYPDSQWGVRFSVLKYLAAHFLGRFGLRVGRSPRRDLDFALAEEICTVCHLMAWVDYYLLEEERVVLDGLLELYVGERSDYLLARSRGFSDLGFIFMLLGAERLARRYFTEAVAIAESMNNPSALGPACIGLGWLDCSKGLLEEGMVHLQKSATAYREAGDLHSWGAPATFLCEWVFCPLGDFASARTLASELVQLSQDTGDPQLANWGYNCLGCVALACEPLDETSAKLHKARDFALAVPAYRMLAVAQGLLGKCHVRQGRLADSLAILGEGIRVIEARKLRALESADVLSGLAEALLAVVERAEGSARRKALRNARQACRRALRCARVFLTYMPEAQRLHGTLAWLSGHRRSARERWRQSIVVAEKCAFVIERARTLLEMGRRLSDVNLLEKAANTFSQAGAKVYLASAMYALAQLEARSGAGATRALQRYEQAIAALEEVKAEYELALARVECARLQRDLGQHAQARANLEKALALFGATGANAQQHKLQEELQEFQPT